MSRRFASDFTEIPEALECNRALREAMLALVAREPMPGSATEGGGRVERLRAILRDATRGAIGLPSAILRVEEELPRDSSMHAENNRVFAAGWAERLVRVQFSRFYNQAVLEYLIARGDAECTVPSSPAEDPASRCSRLLAGRDHDVKSLYQSLVECYAKGHWSDALKIPDHPHCLHVVAPRDGASPGY